MGMMYRNSDLEIRFAMNMNVLIDGLTKSLQHKGYCRPFWITAKNCTPRVFSDKIDHRLEVSTA